MNSNPVEQNETVKLEVARAFDAAPAELFDYFTRPEHLSQWFAPSEAMKTEVQQLDLSVGGKYKIAMIDEENDKSYIVTGEFLEIERPQRLRYTWHWLTEPEDEVSRVTLVFQAQESGTLLQLCHDRFDTEISRDRHGEGWQGCLNRLEKVFV